MSLEGLKIDIDFEIRQVDKLLSTYDDLVRRSCQTPPSLDELPALANILHSFYMGIENIFLSIAKRCDESVPADKSWHKELLDQMLAKASKRPEVISAATSELLTEYLSFRHFSRHSYSFHLDWVRMKPLVVGLADAWASLKLDLENFKKSLR
jgi:hypothetical protein